MKSSITEITKNEIIFFTLRTVIVTRLETILYSTSDPDIFSPDWRPKRRIFEAEWKQRSLKKTRTSMTK